MEIAQLDGINIQVFPRCPICDAVVEREDLRIEDFGHEGSPLFAPTACCSFDDYYDHADQIDLDPCWMFCVKNGIKFAEKQLESHLTFLRKGLAETIAEFSYEHDDTEQRIAEKQHQKELAREIELLRHV